MLLSVIFCTRQCPRFLIRLQFTEPARAHFTTSSYCSSTFEWNTTIRSYINKGQFKSAIEHYGIMRELKIPHDSFTFPIVNRAISSLDRHFTYGGIVHALALQMGFGSDLHFCNTMIAVYLRSGVASDARKLFDEMVVRDLVSWTTMISGYAKGNGCDVFSAFDLFARMRFEPLELNAVAMIVMLQACCLPESGSVGMLFHGYVVKLGFMADFTVHNSLMNMYCAKLHGNEVETIFSEADYKDVVSWNTLMSYYAAVGRFEMVLGSFNVMRKEVRNCDPCIDTLPLVVSAVAKAGCQLWQGEMLHCLATKVGLHDSVLKTSILDLYAKCGEIEKASKVFQEDPSANNSITECAMVSGLIYSGRHQDAIDTFKQIRAEGYYVGVGILKEIVLACAHLGLLQMGKAVHSYLVKNFRNQEQNTSLWTCILNFYIRCGSITSAKHCFDKIRGKDIVAWTSMVEGLGSHGRGHEALTCFNQMIEEGIEPNSATFLSLMSACSHSGLLKEGCEAFCSMRLKHGMEPELEHYTCLVDLLGRSGKLKEALLIILKMIVRPDSRIWGALLAASRVHGCIKVGEYAAQRLLPLEADNVGYYTLLSNIHAGGEKWEEVEALRRLVNKDWNKQPGWSYIEEKPQII